MSTQEQRAADAWGACQGAFLAGGAVLAVLCLLWPFTAALHEIAWHADWGAAGLTLRRLGLIGAGLQISCAATLVALGLGAVFAAGLAARRLLRVVVAWVAACIVLTPPYLYAYAWSLPILPDGLVTASALSRSYHDWITWGRAIWCLGTWSAPLAAAGLHAGWRSAGREVYLVAALDAGPLRALICAALPAMTPWVFVAAALVFIVTLTEFSVCHLCLVQTWNTEILAEAQLGRAGQALLLGWPLVALVGVLVGALLPARGLVARVLKDIAGRDGGPEIVCASWSARWMPLAACGAALAVLAAPWSVFWWYFGDAAALARTWSVFLLKRGETPALLYAAGAGLAACWLALAIDYASSIRGRGYVASGLRVAGWGAAWALIIGGILPPVIMGDAFQAAYVRVPPVYDTWLILSLALAARFAVLPMALMRVTARTRCGPCSDMAALDGASWWQTCRHVRWPLARDALALGVALVILLSLTDVAVTQSLTPPRVGNIALTMLNQIHFGRNDDVIALAFYLGGAVAVAVGAVLLAQSVARRFRQGD